MPMDPMSFWIQASVFWAQVFKQQHEAYLRMLGAVAVSVPHPTAAELSAQAQSSADMTKPMRATVKKPAAATKIKVPDPVIA